MACGSAPASNPFRRSCAMTLSWSGGKLDEVRSGDIASHRGTMHLNVERLTEQSAQQVSIIQFLMTDDPRFATPRRMLDDHDEPRSSSPDPRANFGRKVANKIKMILDGEADDQQNHGAEDGRAIPSTGTPRSVSSVDDDTVDPQPVREGHGFIGDDDVGQETEDEGWELEGVRRRSRDLHMSFVSGPPDAGQHASGGGGYVLEDDKVEADHPELVVRNRYLSCLSPIKQFAEGELVFRYDMNKKWFAVIERVNNIITRAEALREVDACRESMVQELARWHKHGAWRRIPRSKCNNLLTSKWVLKWKDVSGKRTIKARMVAQGFKDAQQTCNSSARGWWPSLRCSSDGGWCQLT